MRQHLISALAGLSAIVAAGAAFAQDDKPVVRFHEYPGNVIHLASWAMVEQGFCEKNGIKCEPVYLAAAPLAQQAAAAGSLEMILSSADVMIQGIANGNDLQVVVPQVANNVYVLVARPEVVKDKTASYPDNMGQMNDMKIGVTTRGSATELQARAYLQGGGVSPDSVTYVAVGAPNTAYSALVSKQIDAAVSWDPMPAICEVTENCMILVDTRKGEGPAKIREMNGSFVNWYARRNYIEKSPDAVAAFRKSISEATAWVKDEKNLDAVIAMASERLKLGDLAATDELIERIVRDMVAQFSNDFQKDSLAGVNDFLVETGLISQSVDVDKIYDSRLTQ